MAEELDCGMSNSKYSRTTFERQSLELGEFLGVVKRWTTNVHQSILSPAL